VLWAPQRHVANRHELSVSGSDSCALLLFIVLWLLSPFYMYLHLFFTVDCYLAIRLYGRKCEWNSVSVSVSSCKCVFLVERVYVTLFPGNLFAESPSALWSPDIHQNHFQPELHVGVSHFGYGLNPPPKSTMVEPCFFGYGSTMVNYGKTVWSTMVEPYPKNHGSTMVLFGGGFNPYPKWLTPMHEVLAENGFGEYGGYGSTIWSTVVNHGPWSTMDKNKITFFLCLGTTSVAFTMVQLVPNCAIHRCYLLSSNSYYTNGS